MTVMYIRMTYMMLILSIPYIFHYLSISHYTASIELLETITILTTESSGSFHVFSQFLLYLQTHIVLSLIAFTITNQKPQKNRNDPSAIRSNSSFDLHFEIPLQNTIARRKRQTLTLHSAYCTMKTEIKQTIKKLNRKDNEQRVTSVSDFFPGPSQKAVNFSKFRLWKTIRYILYFVFRI